MGEKIEGWRIRLVSPPSVDTDEDVRRVLSDEENMYALPTMNKQWTSEEVRARRENHTRLQNEGKGYFYLIFDKDTNEYMGNCGFFLNSETVSEEVEERSGEIGIILDKKFWCNKYATEAHFLFLTFAFEQLKLDKVTSGTSPLNTPMISFFKKYQMTHVKNYWDNGYEWTRYELPSSLWPSTKALFQSSLSFLDKN